jgi:hypothetical protein
MIMDIGSKHVFAEMNSGEVINELDHLIWPVRYELNVQVRPGLFLYGVLWSSSS